jgi:ABC-type multidrug transport system fused ATPase/permease subunit
VRGARRPGAGKTTIVKLLLRLYDPTAGRILLDGVDLREYDVEDLRWEMGVIFQDFVRYELTAGENIAMGQVEALGDRARLLEVAARGGARDLVAHLPEGLEGYSAPGASAYRQYPSSRVPEIRFLALNLQRYLALSQG